MNDTLINEHINTLILQINNADNNILRKYPVEQLVQAINKFPLPNNYMNILGSSQPIIQSLEREFNSEVNSNYYKLLICKLMLASNNHLTSNNYPEKIIQFYYKWFQSIIRDLNNSSRHFSYKIETYLKDINICSLKMFPTPAHVVETSAISKRFLINNGLKQTLEASYFYFSKMKGTQPFYQFHYDYRCRRGFTPDGWEQSFVNIAKMLEVNPEIKGIFAASWFFDPNLEDISPELDFLRMPAIANGAKLFKVGTSKTDIDNATNKSKIRTTTYQNGEYVPSSYVLIWPRNKLLNWAKHSLTHAK